VEFTHSFIFFTWVSMSVFFVYWFCFSFLGPALLFSNITSSSKIFYHNLWFLNCTAIWVTIKAFFLHSCITITLFNFSAFSSPCHLPVIQCKILLEFLYCHIPVISMSNPLRIFLCCNWRSHFNSSAQLFLHLRSRCSVLMAGFTRKA